MRFLLRGLAIVLLVCCGMLAGFLAYRSAHHSSVVALQSRLDASMTGGAKAAGASASPGSAGTAGSTAGPAAAADTAPQSVPVPETIPDVRMISLDGTQKSLRDYLGHPLIINFWATWCDPCRREMPLLQQLWTAYRPDGLQIVGVAVDSRDAVEQYLRHTAVKYPLLVGEAQGSAAVARFGIDPVLPFSVFADARGRIVAVKIGELHRGGSRLHHCGDTGGRQRPPDAPPGSRCDRSRAA